MYGKHFASMYTGSMVGSGISVFAVWGWVLANMHLPQAQPAKKEKGVASIEINPKLLSAILGGTEEEIEKAIEYLCAPDANSRSQEEGGRRLVREGQFLYRIVNAQKYNAIRDEITRRDYMRNYMRNYRNEGSGPCAYCAKPDQTILDHIVPTVRGGGNEDENLVFTCKSCNSSKGATDLVSWLETSIRINSKATLEIALTNPKVAKVYARMKEEALVLVNFRKQKLAQLADTDRDTDITETLSGKKPDGEVKEGFGIATKEQPATAFDVTQARHLEKAVRKLPPRKTGIASCRPSTWAEHFRLLRTKDKIPEKDIARVVGWYGEHIGEEFVPLAFSGESFRKKWPALERAAGRDKTAVDEISPQAAAIAVRVNGLGWPKGSAKDLPAAAQACWSAFAVWNERRVAFTKGLPPGPVAGFAKHLATKIPSASSFVEQWLRDAHDRVKKWEAWTGNLTPYIFTPEHKRFTAMGRGWAVAFCNDASRWDKFVEGLNNGN